MAITISGENNNDRILASDGVIDQISGINIVGVLTATSFTGDLTGNVTGNLTGNVNSTSPLLLQTGGSERIRLTSNNEIGIAGANYGTSGQVLTSGGSGSAVSWTTPAVTGFTNGSNNRVVTATSGSGLNAESNLTYDGNTLFASGNITAASDGNRLTQGGVALTVRHLTNSAMRANHFIHDDFPTGSATYFIQATESGVTNDRNLCLQGYGGKVKIGSSSEPVETLDVTGNVKATSINLANTIFHTGDTDTLMSFAINTIKFETAGSERLRIASDGKIGIGNFNSITPARKVHIHEASSAAVYATFTNSSTGTAANNGFTLGVDSSEHAIFNNYSNTDIITICNGSERLRITSAGEVLINESSARSYVDGAGNTQTPKLQVEADDNTSSAISLTWNSGGGAANRRASFMFARTADGSAVSNNSVLGEVLFMGEGNSTLEKAASIRAEVDGTPGTNDMPGRLIFSTSADGSDSPTERLRITSTGDIEATGNLKTNNLSGRNVVINGDMRVAQRATSANMSSSGNHIPVCDRWQYNRNGPSATIAQVAEAPAGRGFKYSLKWTNTSPVGSISAGNVVKYSYAIERQDIQRLGYGSANGKKATLSFWAKGSLSGKIGVSCVRDSRIFSANEDIVANTWKFVEITIPVDTSTGFTGDDNATGFYFGITWGAGSNSTSGATNSWINFHNAYTAGFTAGQQGAYLTTNGSTFQITGVQLEIGSKSTPFEHKLLSDELARCYRYYNKVFDVEGQSGEKPASLAVYENSSTICTTFNFPKMRVVPTLDITNGTNKFMVRSNNVSDHFNTLTMRYGTTTTAELFQGTNVSGTSGYSGFLRGADTDVYIAFDAEL